VGQIEDARFFIPKGHYFGAGNLLVEKELSLVGALGGNPGRKRGVKGVGGSNTLGGWERC